MMTDEIAKLNCFLTALEFKGKPTSIKSMYQRLKEDNLYLGGQSRCQGHLQVTLESEECRYQNENLRYFGKYWPVLKQIRLYLQIRISQLHHQVGMTGNKGTKS